MIFYYTATGNSLYIAKKLSENPVSIPQAMNSDSLSFADDKIGIVCPVYAGEIPRLVQEFIAKASFNTDYFFFVFTYGKDDTVAGEFAAELCARHGINVQYAASVKMVDNYLPSFDINEEMAIDKQIDEQLSAIQSDLAAGKHGIPTASADGRNLYEMVKNMRQEHPEIMDGHQITVGEDCTGCGICTKVCPLGNFQITDGRAARKNDTCDFCLACAHHCPKKAISLSMGERNPDVRYRNEHISLAEIMEANNQTNI